MPSHIIPGIIQKNETDYMNQNPFGIVQLSRTKHDGTVEVLVQFKTEKPAWIPLSTLLAIREDSLETVPSES